MKLYVSLMIFGLMQVHANVYSQTTNPSVSSQMIFQDITITGTVTDAEGISLPGVNVTVKGTTQGTVTGANGMFSLPVQDENAILVF